MNPSLLLLAAALLSVDAFVPVRPSSSAVRSTSTTTTIRFLQEEEPSTNTLAQEKKKQEEEEPVYFNILSETTTAGSSSVMDEIVATNSAAGSNGRKVSSAAPAINGWVPKEDYALWGLPGAIAPTGYFDPLGFARRGLPLNDAKRLREAEVQHGRVAMVATVGYWAGEAVQNNGPPFGITGPANDQLQQVPAPALAVLTLAVAAAELYRARRGWVEPQFRIGSNTLWTLRDSYYPGDLRFQRMQTKELSNGRLAMLGWAGMCAQELVNHRTIGETLEFYQTLYTGGNPY